MIVSVAATNDMAIITTSNSAPNTMIIYVKKSVANSANGKSWAAPFKYLREALDAAPSFIGSIVNGMIITNVEIWVARGTYYPDEPVSRTVIDNDRTLSFTMLNKVQIYGGFDGSETALSQRDWSGNKTYLSGDIDQNDGIEDFNGNSYHVIKNSYASNSTLNNSAILDGIIIRGGYANGEIDRSNGGGIYSINASPIIRNCVIKENHANQNGGATYMEASAPEFINCLIYKNTSLSDGVVAYNSQANPTFQNCTITQNTSLNSNTSIYNNDSDPKIYNTILWKNGEELAAPISSNSSPLVSHCIIEGGYPPGALVINDHPRFVNPYKDDYSLGNCSPAIGNGDNSLNSSLFDLDGMNRVINTSIDIGAYEHTVGNASNFSIIHVDNDSSTPKDGSNWSNAYNHLQDALAAARVIRGCIQIWVAEGEYYPDEGSDYRDNAQDSSFMMLNEVEIYGGFLGSELSLNDRNSHTNETILSGDINQDGDTTNNSYHVVRNKATSSDPLTSSAVLDGFIITEGNAIGDGFGHGGGIFNQNYCSPIIRNCTIKNNYAIQGGGATDYQSPIYMNCVFYKNTASYGGAVSNGYGFFINCSFSQNTASIRGGAGIYSSIVRPTFINSILWGNYATQSKELDYQEVPPKLINCIIEGGFTGYDSKYNLEVDPKFLNILGGDLRLSACSPAIDAGMLCYNKSTKDLSNNPRTAYGKIDIGAYEHQSPSTLKIIFVDSTRTGGSGNNWGDAYALLQDALIGAKQHNGCTQVWVAKGTYFPDEGVLQANNFKGSTFKLYNDVEMYGGFIGSEDSLLHRNWADNKTILSGDLTQSGSTFLSSWNVVSSPNNDKIYNSSVIDGFSICHGYSTTIKGAGFLLKNASPVIKNCEIHMNHSRNGGGGMLLDHSNALITNCDFRLNSSSSGNSNNSGGGGISVTDSSAIRISNSTFDSNSNSGRGGAIRVGETSKIEIINSLFYKNSSINEGGALYLTMASASILNCTFNSNITDSQGGAIYLNSGAQTLINNSILYGNSSEIEKIGSLNDPAISNSIVKGGYSSGVNILDIGPKFVDSLAGDLSLMVCSPAIDAGINGPLNTNLDIVGNPRLFNATGSGPKIIDIGAYEFQQLNTECCVDSLMLSGTIISGTYEAALNISCDGVISAGSDVILNAPEINLTDEFNVEDTGILETQSEGCNNN